MLTFAEQLPASKARERIIAVTRQMLEGHDETVHLGDIAVLAGVSRQTLHYQFRGKAELLLEVCNAVDAEVRDLEDDAAATTQGLAALGALRAHVDSRARIAPRLNALVGGLERLRVVDPAAQSVWRDREEQRYQQVEALAARLAAEGQLTPGWTVPAAARMIWSVTSQRAWRDLVAEAGWTSQEWSVRTLALLEATLIA